MNTPLERALQKELFSGPSLNQGVMLPGTAVAGLVLGYRAGGLMRGEKSGCTAGLQWTSALPNMLFMSRQGPGHGRYQLEG